MSQKKVVPESAVPEVQQFLAVREKLHRLKESYPEVFEALDALKQEYNQALEAADKVVRAKQISCGPFDLYQFQTKYDADKLAEELGESEFLRVGGVVKTVKTYDIDKAKLEAHITSGSIDKEVVDHVRTISPRYKKPDKIEGI